MLNLLVLYKAENGETLRRKPELLKNPERKQETCDMIISSLLIRKMKFCSWKSGRAGRPRRNTADFHISLSLERLRKNITYRQKLKFCRL